MSFDEKRLFLINILYFAVWSAILYFAYKFALSYLLPFLIGILLAYVLQKPAKFLSTKIRVKNGICAAILVTVSYTLIIGTIVLMSWTIVVNSSAIINFLTEFFNVSLEYLTRFYNRASKIFLKFSNGSNETFENILSDAGGQLAKKAAQTVTRYATAIMKALPSFMISSVVTVVASFYIAKDFDKLLLFVKNLMKQKTIKKISLAKEIITKNIFKFAGGYFLLLLITFCELTLGFLLLKTKPMILLAALVALVDLLPVVGTGTVLLPWAIFSFMSGDTIKGIGLILLYVVITVVRNFLEPHIIGKKLGINPLFTLMAMFVGLRLAGIVGLILLPIALIVVFDYYREQINESNNSNST